VAHSLSPTLHTAGYRATGLTEWSYAAHDVGADELASWVAPLDETWRGLSLTMPLKEVASTSPPR
jgi:shikimate dehydrogenase